MTVDWRPHAACRGHDPELWFPTTGQPAKEAKAICAECPVRLECGTTADQFGDVGGIWGGKRYSPAKAASRYKSPLSFEAGLKPHGTVAAIARHNRRHQPLCPACTEERSRLDRLRREAANA